MTDADKQRIATNFGQSAVAYHHHAYLQKCCAHQLLSLLDQCLEYSPNPLPTGPILEIGCGTGFISQLLLQRFGYGLERVAGHGLEHGRGRSLQITDLSPAMVRFCQDYLTQSFQQPEYDSILSLSPSRSGKSSQVPLFLNENSVLFEENRARAICAPVLMQEINQAPAATPPQTSIVFRVLDAETSHALPNTYSLIVGGFVAQWFKHLVPTIQRLLGQLQSGGWLFLSFPGHESFPEWRQICAQLGLPFTAHPLPDAVELIRRLHLRPSQYALHTKMWPTYYDSAAAFFRNMKKIGAGFSQVGTQLPPQQMRQLLRAWQPSIVQTDASSCVSSYVPSCVQFSDVQPSSTQSFDMQSLDGRSPHLRHRPQIIVQYQVVYLAIAKL